MRSYPTNFEGTQFRSRLEARWAAFFDLKGWRWEYEPFDLDGYIPDFVILAKRPILVEVKPLFWSDASCASKADDKLEACGTCWWCVSRKLTRSGWNKGDIWLVGVSAVLDETGYPKAGWHGQPNGAVDVANGAAPFGWGEANWGWCDECQTVTVVNDSFRWDCSFCGTFLGKRFVIHNDVETERTKLDWRQAGNRTQWRPVR